MFSQAYNHFNAYTYYWFLLFIIFCLFFGIYLVFKLELNNDYKIYNHFYVKCCNILYFIFFILVILLLRAFTWGVSRDVKDIARTISHYWYLNQFLFIIVVCLIILYLILIHKIRNYFIKQLIKQFLYLTRKEGVHHWGSRYKNFTFIQRFLYELWWSYFIFYERLDPISRFIIKNYENEKTSNIMKKVSLFLYKIINYSKRLIPPLIIPCLFFYDYYTYDGVITNVFYYLPFYYIFINWRNCSFFIYHTDIYFDQVIASKYYPEEVDAIYVDLSDAETEIIFSFYIKNNFVRLDGGFGGREKIDHEKLSFFWRGLAILRKFDRIAENSTIFRNGDIYVDFHNNEENLENLKRELGFTEKEEQKVASETKSIMDNIAKDEENFVKLANIIKERLQKKIRI